MISAAGSLWVANEGSSEISQIDPVSDAVTSIPLDSAVPYGIASTTRTSGLPTA